MTVALARSEATLESRYASSEGWFYMTGMQALVRLPIQQRLRDAAAGLNTGGYISGYRGSPLGRYDIELWRAGPLLESHNIVFRPGLNEDLAATAIWGAQHLTSFPGATVDGVFGIWYGKGPGVDRSGDALRHANFTGVSPKGGVIALAGDDHGAKSSTAVNFSDTSFIAVGMPVLYPSNTQELIDFGLHGIAMSRFSGCWVGVKVVTDVAEGGGTVYVGLDSPAIAIPERPSNPPGGVGARAIDMPVAQEERLYNHKLPAALAYARANALNRIVGGANARVGVVGAGKAWQDLLQALGHLRHAGGGALDLRLLKVGMVWPLDPVIVRDFALGLDLIVVIEEKRPILEDQIRAILYGCERAPRIVGKFFDGVVFDPAHGALAIPNFGETTPELVAQVLFDALRARDPDCPLAAPPVSIRAIGNRPAPVRSPGFCAGCPHNRSTRVPEGSRALAGIGCHTMAMYVNPFQTTTVSHMGGEGAMWLGQQPFTSQQHVFANLGDGTYAHSGVLAVRQAVAADVPITYKILYNGFVSMTGGQPIEGGMTPVQILAELAAEGVKKMALVVDEPERYSGIALPAGVSLRHRDAMDETQREFREFKGVSVILYDQPCATERRRLRKRGKWTDPAIRTFIHPDVCEGCGDCGRVSNCMAIEPLETEFGRKRRINQSSCNKDYSCVEGFCPSFVTVHGGRLRRVDVATPLSPYLPAIPDPVLPEMGERYSVLVAGIGGSGVVTISQTLAVAAYLDGLFSSNLDLTGLSQKYGAVTAHVRMAREPGALHATRIASGEADALIGCDLIVAAGDECVSKLTPQTRAVISADLTPTADFARNPNWSVDAEQLIERLRSLLGDGALVLDGQRLAQALLGDAIASNMFMFGAAWQKGLIPLRRAAIERAIELNGVAIEANKQAFEWGRRAAHDLASVESLVAEDEPRADEAPSLDALIARRAAHLTEYRDASYAARYRALVERVRRAEASAGLGEALTSAVARSYHKLLAVKDEWEVARLFAAPEFQRALAQEFEGRYRLRFHIGAWPFARPDPSTGMMRKGEAGPWAMTAFRVMARLKFLRGTWLDPFRNSDERKLERRLVDEFEADVEELLARLAPANHALAVRLAGLPETIRGYGRIKEASAAEAAKARATALRELRAAKAPADRAA